MGRTLHNKIHLGRNSVLPSKRIQAALFAGAFATMGLVWSAIRFMQ
ncbi:MAG: hypothetical protein V4723_03825 [Pseudomonadota bacterium]